MHLSTHERQSPPTPGVWDLAGLPTPARCALLHADTTLDVSFKGSCRIRVFRDIPHQPEGMSVVIATDLQQEAPCLEFAGAVQEVAAQACALYNLDLMRLLFVEEYDDRLRGVTSWQLNRLAGGRFGKRGGISFAMVALHPDGERFGEATWWHLPTRNLERLLGLKSLATLDGPVFL